MPAIAPTWTAERVKRLKSCFDAGLSCRQIAADIGVSRNAVIGKLSRLNLTRDKGDEPAARNKADAAPAAKATPRRPYAMLAIYAGPDAPDEFEPIDDTRHCSLFELSEARCRWPISTPGAADFCFCGNTPLDALPYCSGHSRLAYRPGSRQRVARG
jgi:GcrA cell cycle regulator